MNLATSIMEKKKGLLDLRFAFGARVAITILSLILQILLARLLGPSGRGSYTVCVIFSLVLSCFFMVGLNGAVGYFVASKQMTPSNGISSIFFLGSIEAIFCIFFGLVLLNLPIPFFDRASITSFYIALAWAPLQIFNFSLVLLLLSIKEFKCYAFCSVAEVISQLLFILLLVGCFKLGTEGSIISCIAGTIFSIFISISFLRKRYKVSWSFPKGTIIYGLLHYGYRYWFSELSQLLHVQAGPLFLGFFASEKEIGIFSVGFALVARVIMLPDSIVSVIQPRVAEDRHGRPDLIAQSARVSGLISFCVLIFIGIFSMPIVSILFSSKFLGAVDIIWVLLPGIALRCSTKLILPYLNGTNRPGVQSWATIGSLFVNYIFLSFLYPLFGLIGAGIAMSLSYIVNSLILIVAFHHYSKTTFLKEWILRKSDINQLYLSLKSIFKK